LADRLFNVKNTAQQRQWAVQNCSLFEVEHTNRAAGGRCFRAAVERIMAFCLASRHTKMTLEDFRQSLTSTEPPAELTLALTGLCSDAKGDWTRAHESAQQDEGKDGSWVHAYLHRKEGDQGNAAYSYSRARKPVCHEPLDAEWVSIVRELLG